VEGLTGTAKPKLTVERATQLMLDAFAGATERETSTGDGILIHILQKGHEPVVIKRKLREDWNDDLLWRLNVKILVCTCHSVAVLFATILVIKYNFWTLDGWMSLKIWTFILLVVERWFFWINLFEIVIVDLKGRYYLTILSSLNLPKINLCVISITDKFLSWIEK